ncbi:alpha/beta hydrolase [Streptomyces qinzhouensis]|uniref:Alpha/beta hydrolase n=1 Tax=Streptomyces qinzhouensis TaxID=2599401 RepID=A0A5B8JKP3_9ACTN|nr:alpha/beta hydrolase [Streptomyces qinzhouensis]
MSGATLASAVLTGTATVQAAPGPGPGARAQPPALSWTPCHQPGQECAYLTVPVDYREPHGPTMRLAVSRILSTSPGERRGTLMAVPGGPGGSGVKRLTDKGPALRAQLGGAYDLVALDPRGVGGSSKAACGLDAKDLRVDKLRSWPGADGDISENAARSRRIAEACARNGGDAVRSLSSLNQARDLDRFRAALGEEKVSFWSTSYGAYVTAIYAQRFGHRTDRVVLDSSGDPDHRRVARGWLANGGPAVELRFADFAAWAADPARGPGLRLAERPEEVRSLVIALAERLDRVPKTRTDTEGIALDGAILRNTLLRMLSSDSEFPALAGLIRDARDPKAVVAIPGDVKQPLSDQDAAVWVGVICNDVNWPGPGAGYPRAVAEDRARYPLTGGLPANITPCAFWKNADREKTVRITGEGPSNILMIQARRDPATPHFGAVRMRQALGDRARMVTVERGGHGVYLGVGNPCGDAVVTAFLKTGERPEGDISCGG